MFQQQAEIYAKYTIHSCKLKVWVYMRFPTNWELGNPMILKVRSQAAMDNWGDRKGRPDWWIRLC